MLDYGYHGYPGKSSGHKKLGTVWNYALDKTGECVQYACGLSWIKTESVGDIAALTVASYRYEIDPNH